MAEKLGLSFHRTFPLSRDTLRQVLYAAYNNDSLSYSTIRSDTTLGTVQVQSVRGYAKGTGLLDADENITSFGRTVLDKDPNLSETSTQWLMHFNMVAPYGFGPAYWNRLLLTRVHPGEIISPQEVASEIGRVVQEQEGREIESDTLRKSATAFLRSYSREDAFGPLRLIRQEEDEYEVGEPAPLDTAVFAYALADYWHHVWKDYASVNLSSITGEDGPAALFLLGSGDVNQILRDMQEQGLLRLERMVRPHTAYRLWERPEDLLERIYA